ncbi:aconitase [Salmonella bongori]|nr:aconitase [Salmonella bongori]
MLGRSKAVAALEKRRQDGDAAELTAVFACIQHIAGQENVRPEDTEVGSVIYAVKPGDGSAREQAASCQRVIGGLANIAQEYATKRYRSNVIQLGNAASANEGDTEFLRWGIISIFRAFLRRWSKRVLPLQGMLFATMCWSKKSRCILKI